MSIIKEIKRNSIEFTILFIILIIGTILFFYFDYHPHNQRRVVYVTGASYFGWSIIHHYRQKDLELSIVIEYFVIAIFAALMLSSTLF